MVITVTLNPLIERRLFYKSIHYGDGNRTSDETVLAGGKGINVSRQLNKLGLQNLSLTFAGGYSGKLFKKLLSVEGIISSYVITEDETRNATVVFDQNSGKVSTFFGKNSEVSAKESDEFLARLEKMISNCEIVVFAGSSPSQTTDNIFKSGIEIANRLDKISVLDTYGTPLLNSLDAVPTIVHNNLEELNKEFNLPDDDKIFGLLDDLYSRGIKQAYITNGGKVSFISNFDFHFKVTPPQINQVYAAGSGDAFTAGVVYGWHNNLTFDETTIIASCLGSANASKYDVCNNSLKEADNYRTGVKIIPVGKKMNIIDDKNV